MTTGTERSDRIAAFFDMDRTLLSDSSSVLWARYLRERGELSLGDMMGLGLIMLRHRLGMLDMVATTRKLVATLAERAEMEHIALTRLWFRDVVAGYVAAEGRRWLEGHRRLGHRIALITASPNYVADELATYLGLSPQDVLATRFEVRNGLFTGQLVEPMVYGQGKVEAAQAYALRHGLDLAASYFYTDSIVDLPLLNVVGHPVAVNPDPPLRRMAKEQGWPVVRFY